MITGIHCRDYKAANQKVKNCFAQINFDEFLEAISVQTVEAIFAFYAVRLVVMEYEMHAIVSRIFADIFAVFSIAFLAYFAAIQRFIKFRTLVKIRFLVLVGEARVVLQVVAFQA